MGPQSLAAQEGRVVSRIDHRGVEFLIVLREPKLLPLGEKVVASLAEQFLCLVHTGSPLITQQLKGLVQQGIPEYPDRLLEVAFCLLIVDVKKVRLRAFILTRFWCLVLVVLGVTCTKSLVQAKLCRIEFSVKNLNLPANFLKNYYAEYLIICKIK